MDPSTAHFPVWSILSDAGAAQFRWVRFPSSSVSPPSTPSSISPPLPSISHLLLESQIVDGGRGGVPSLFRTGSGKPLAVKPDSVRKAMLVVGEEHDNAKIPKQSLGNPPMFQRGSGKPVSLKQASIQRAPSVLEEEDFVVEDNTNFLEKNNGDFPMFKTGSGKLVPLKQSSIKRAMAVLGEGDFRKKDNTNILVQSIGELPMFKTESGKLASLKQSSIMRAMAVIGEGDLLEKDHMNITEQKSGDSPVFKSGLGMLVPLKQSSIQRAMVVLGEGDFQEKGFTGNFSNFFSTSSEKPLDISSYDILRAKALLNLDEASNTGASVEGLPAFVQFHSIKSHEGNGCIMDKSGQQVVDKERIMGGKMNDSDRYLPTKQQNVGALPKFVNSHDFKPGIMKPPVLFQTAGGKSVSISKCALKRAKSLLGELDLDPNNDSTVNDTSSNKENELYDLCPPNTFQSDIFIEGRLHQGSHCLLAQRKSVTCQGFSMCKDDSLRGPEACSTSGNTHPSLLKTPRHGQQSICPLAEMPKNSGAFDDNLSDVDYKRRVSGKKHATPPFKKPRRSRFVAPLSSFLEPSGSSMMSKAELTCRPVLSRHLLITKKKSIKEYFGRPPEHHSQIQHISEDVQYMNADRAETFVFLNLSGETGIGIDAFQNMLEQSGASLQKASREWIINHYKWIVWKLASLERSYPAQTMIRYLTVDNVLEELKYRYDREVNYGHQSALKKVLEGGASAASMMVLCISAVRSYTTTNLGQQHVYKNEDKLNQKIRNDSKFTAKIELTDGWYSIHACLDSSLTMQLRSGKLFVGQKLRIWGASLSSWVSPVSPLEASPEINLMLHVNGTYRAHWFEKLGLCRSAGLPLAFRCIKPYGGTVPLTLIGITRIYPVLYKERFSDGGSLVRTERMESRILQLFNQRRCNVVESIISEPKEENGLPDLCDSDEGAKIFKLLTSTAEPEVLMADMSSEQLNSVAIYQAKKEAAMQSSLLMKIEKALDDAGLSAREVSPFVKVRVVGLTSKGCARKPTKEGLITIWNPSETQLDNLVEGHIYFVSGLTPLKDETNKLILQARGSMTTWKKLPSSAIDFFEPFFAPRKSTSLLNFGEVALSSEFDIAAVVVYVGEVYKSVSQMMQWVFVTDGFPLGYSAKCKGDSNHVLAIKFCISSADSLLLSPANSSLTGSPVGFCNLIKRSRDPVNHIWMAEATECSTYSENLTKFPHLKEAAAAASEWAKLFIEDVNKLKELVLSIVSAGRV